MRERQSFEKALDGMILVAKVTKDAAEFAPFPFLKAAVGGLLVLLETIRQAKSNKEGILLLAQDATRLVETIKQEVTNATPEIDPLLRLVSEEFVAELNAIVTTVQFLSDRSLVKRLVLNASDKVAIEDARRRLDQSFRVFMIATQTQIRLEQRRLLHVRLLSRLQVAPARWNEAKKCDDGSQLALLDEIRAWGLGDTSSTKSIYWLTDVAGTGRSAIAHHMASEWKRANQLGGCFFFSREATDRKNLKLFCNTIASHLAEWHSDLRPAVCEALENNPTIASMAFREQFETLFMGPFSQAGRSLILVIDSLDECAIETRTELLNAITEPPKSCHTLKIFITGGPERDISDALGGVAQGGPEVDLEESDG